MEEGRGKTERKGRKKIIIKKGLIDTSQVHAHLASVAYVRFAHVGTGQDSNCPLGILQVNHTIYQLVLCLFLMVDVNYFSGSAVLRKTAENERCVEVLNGRAMQGSNHVLLCGGAEGLVMILRQVSIVRLGWMDDASFDGLLRGQAGSGSNGGLLSVKYCRCYSIFTTSHLTNLFVGKTRQLLLLFFFEVACLTAVEG
ncbi:hypothetical protein M752DRAFT_9885 [Aspergillus phoenicis ATCC 13157]|uniref:Uncharacterized protein n=1 Tax=Aspergillus phoenicis ATCC 13157 TaxID=1353007 RepID=A0A370Q0U7_ASPPH|nr:hypothetical protein M752DRAFT_9885 [Aspergillus phoenicis ATCC 13157]